MVADFNIHPQLMLQPIHRSFKARHGVGAQIEIKINPGKQLIIFESRRVQGTNPIARGRLKANSDIASVVSDFRFTGVEVTPNVPCTGTCMPRTHAAVLRCIRGMIDRTDPLKSRASSTGVNMSTCAAPHHGRVRLDLDDPVHAVEPRHYKLKA